MCFPQSRMLKPQSPRREAYGNNYDRYLQDLGRYQRALAEYHKDKKKRRARHNAHDAGWIGAVAGASAGASAGCGGGGGGGGGC
ncbi:hypothetical protein N7513_001400 [Penicillium frequentans]|uniref:Uncharacterized protein n=1 Tax=Penicillium frequentans TaxID=3151616 RepID=A0AAD6GCQ3_9EURO|nr:hypothetical protein N7494_008771 [Penicillium glabrum]KAJ5565158.1 hypothetical protein N7513_001400 [Penicillium glabrum]